MSSLTIRTTEMLPGQGMVSSLPGFRGGPFPDDVLGAVISLYGPRPVFETPNGPTTNFHYGIDLWAWPPPPLLALSDGIVEYAVAGDAKVGNWLRVRNGEWTWDYYHLADPPFVKPGDDVLMGDALGVVGSTGLSTGPHLHLGMTLNGESIDPLPILMEMPPQSDLGAGIFMGNVTYSADGKALAVFSGGTVGMLEKASRVAGAVGAWVQDAQGEYALLIVDGPDFLRAQFMERFPRGFLSTVAVTLINKN